MEVVKGHVTVGASDDAGGVEKTEEEENRSPAFASVEAFVADLERIGEAHDCTVQAFDARYVAGREHLSRALDRADRARERGEAIARERSVEILLYAAGRRQIERALEMGVSEGTQPVVVLVATDVKHAATHVIEDERTAADAVADLVEPTAEPAATLDARDDDRLQSFFDISDAERAATDAGIQALVCERVALLAVEK